jgi:hypothetical protein
MDTGSGAFLIPGSGIRDKNQDRIHYKQSGSYFREPKNNVCVKILEFFDAVQESVIENSDPE